MLSEPATTWSAVRIEPRALMMTPAPSPLRALLPVRVLRLDLDERGEDLLVHDGRARGLRLQVLDGLLDDVRRDRPGPGLVERRARLALGDRDGCRDREQKQDGGRGDREPRAPPAEFHLRVAAVGWVRRCGAGAPGAHPESC